MAIRDYVFRICRPAFWSQCGPTCDEYSAAMEEQIDARAPITRLTECTVDLNGVRLWVANYPYAYGRMSDDPLERLPTARVRKKLRKFVEAHAPARPHVPANPWALAGR